MARLGMIHAMRTARYVNDAFPFVSETSPPVRLEFIAGLKDSESPASALAFTDEDGRREEHRRDGKAT
jgi:hypothetical protein